MSDEHDMTLKYNGRVLVMTAVVNTEQDPYVVQKKVIKACRGDRLDAVLMRIQGYTGQGGEVAWKAAQSVATKVAAHPAAQSTNEPLTKNVAKNGGPSLSDVTAGMPGGLGVPTITEAIMELDRICQALIQRGMDVAHLAGLSVGAGVRVLRESGASRAEVISAVEMLWDGEIDAAIGVPGARPGTIIKSDGEAS